MGTQHFDNGKNAKARQKLVSDLAGLASGRSFISIEENEMLSLMVDEAFKGVDIETQYPDFYGKLLKNAALRRAFLDTLEMLDAEKAGALTPLPPGERPNLAFLRKKPQQPKNQEPWLVTLNRTILQLKDVFSPSQAVRRNDANLYEDRWFTILRGEIELGGTSYSVILEGELSKETEDALSASINIAMTLESTQPESLPIFATLRWGDYNETVTIIKEGRARFPDIPFSANFDQQNQEIRADLDLVLEVKPA